MMMLEEGNFDVEVFPFLSWILDNDQPGSMGAAMVFKAITQRRRWVENQLGDDYADPMNIDGLIKRGFAPDGYVAWQPEEGRLLYTAQTLPEHVMNRMLEYITETGVPGIPARDVRDLLEKAKPVQALGRKKYQLVVPEEVAATCLRCRWRTGSVGYSSIRAGYSSTT